MKAVRDFRLQGPAAFLIGAALVFASMHTPVRAQASITAADRNEIAKLAGPDWTIKSDETSVTIESTFDVYFVNLISRALPPPEFSHAITTEELRKETKPEHYVIRLEYGPALDRAELDRRVKRRHDLLERRGVTKDDWSGAITQFHAIKIPRYSGPNYSIYRILPDRPGLQFYPPSAVAKIGALKELLDVVRKPLLHPYD